uniref:uncharacterized protein n=1 Tax=Myxine glutinosa TaxID=7769 RepID=UPI00358EF2CF
MLLPGLLLLPPMLLFHSISFYSIRSMRIRTSDRPEVRPGANGMPRAPTDACRTGASRGGVRLRPPRCPSDTTAAPSSCVCFRKAHHPDVINGGLGPRCDPQRRGCEDCRNFRVPPLPVTVRFLFFFLYLCEAHGKARTRSVGALFDECVQWLDEGIVRVTRWRAKDNEQLCFQGVCLKFLEPQEVELAACHPFDHVILPLVELKSHTQLLLDFVSFSPVKVEKLLSNLDSDSATGPDGISPQVLTSCSAALSHPLSVLFTLFCSRSSASILEISKHYRFTQKGAKTHPCNYRPISLLPISVLGPVLFLVFINDLSDSLENPLYLFADDTTLCHSIPLPSDRQSAASSLSADLDKIRLVKQVEHVFQS